MKMFYVMGAALVLLMACNTPKIINSWRDPTVTIDTASLNKFMVAALLKNQTVRRQVEDQMSAMVPGKAVQSYKKQCCGSSCLSEVPWISRQSDS